MIWLYLDSRIIFLYAFKKLNLLHFQENLIRKAFVYISFENLYKLGQPYKLGQKVSNYDPEYTPPSVVEIVLIKFT